jgi:hypothetical protein
VGCLITATLATATATLETCFGYLGAPCGNGSYVCKELKITKTSKQQQQQTQALFFLFVVVFFVSLGFPKKQRTPPTTSNFK